MTNGESEDRNQTAVREGHQIRHLLRRATEPVGMIDMRQLAKLQSRSNLAVRQRLDFLYKLKSRYGTDDNADTDVGAADANIRPLSITKAKPVDVASMPQSPSARGTSEALFGSGPQTSVVPTAPTYRVKRPDNPIRLDAQKPCMSGMVDHVQRKASQPSPEGSSSTNDFASSPVHVTQIAVPEQTGNRVAVLSGPSHREPPWLPVEIPLHESPATARDDLPDSGTATSNGSPATDMPLQRKMVRPTAVPEIISSRDTDTLQTPLSWFATMPASLASRRDDLPGIGTAPTSRSSATEIPLRGDMELPFTAPDVNSSRDTDTLETPLSRFATMPTSLAAARDDLPGSRTAPMNDVPATGMPLQRERARQLAAPERSVSRDTEKASHLSSPQIVSAGGQYDLLIHEQTTSRRFSFDMPLQQRTSPFEGDPRRDNLSYRESRIFTSSVPLQQNLAPSDHIRPPRRRDEFFDQTGQASRTPAPTSPLASSGNKFDVAAVARQVRRILGRQIRIERERRGLTR